MSALLELRNVEARYGSTKALHGISLVVEEGSVDDLVALQRQTFERQEAAGAGPPEALVRRIAVAVADHRAGEILVDCLLRLIRKEPAEGAVLPVKLMVRDSSLRSASR